MIGRTDNLRFAAALCIMAGLLSCQQEKESSLQFAGKDWPEYLGGPGRNHYSTLDQIDSTNVDRLEVAWVHHTGDYGELQCNLLEVNGTLYGTTAACEAFALDATTGTELWRFAPAEKKRFLKTRGVAFWQKNGDQRILFTYDEWLYTLDARTGKPVPAFGDSGKVSLKAGLGESAKDKYVMSRTPGAVFEDLIIMPLVVNQLPGYIQAFNIETGSVEWVFHTIPKPGEYGYETWPEGIDENELIGGVSNWSGMAIDKERGILFAPTGSGHSPSDFWGGNRKGENLFANSLLALDVRTGKRLWHYQIVHHDFLDRDLPSPPSLATINRDGEEVDVVVQVTKTGQVFVFERETGEPVFPIEEVPVPASQIDGEHAWPTQPMALVPKPFSRQSLTVDDLNSFSRDKDSLQALFRNATVGMYTPLSEKPTIVFPGYDGGAEWGGIAISPDGIMYVNANEMAWVSTLSPTGSEDRVQYASRGEQLYMNTCSPCHQKDRSGNPASGYPSLKNLRARLPKNRVADIISKGQGMMPGFPQISGEEKASLLAFLLEEAEVKMVADPVKKTERPKIPWKFNGFKKFLDSEGLPGISPPWGTLTAIDLNTGQHIWQTPLGELEALTNKGIPPTGTENYGGPLVTASGLLFIAATKDNKFRAFAANDGRLLWETTLPASGFATPTTFEANGRQYIVIACGGTKLGTEKGDAIVAFTLKQK